MIGFNVSWLSEKKKEKISYYAFSLSAIFVSVKFFFCSPILKKKKKTTCTHRISYIPKWKLSFILELWIND